MNVIMYAAIGILKQDLKLNIIALDKLSNV